MLVKSKTFVNDFKSGDLLDASNVYWEHCEQTALLVSDLVEGLHDRLPPMPNIGQVKATIL